MERKIHTTTATRKTSAAPPEPPNTAVRLSNECRKDALAAEPAIPGIADKLEKSSGYLSLRASTKPGTELEKAREFVLAKEGASW